MNVTKYHFFADGVWIDSASMTPGEVQWHIKECELMNPGKKITVDWDK